ncbi:MAG: PEGA domain-containing protein [Deltaproteobacteria bacterium]|nr:PEGA domain-containing protein [Deltaproteobacteria bacterium]
MIFLKKSSKITKYILFFSGVPLILAFGAQVTAAALTTNPQPNGSQGTLVQWTPYPTPYPYPQPYPPSYYPPSSESYGTRDVRPSGWIFIEVDPPDATVFIDGNKLEPSKDNTYEEGVLTGMHKVVVKKSGYQDYLEIVTVSTAATQRLMIRLKKIR